MPDWNDARTYKQGWCDAFAIALGRRFGWRLGIYYAVSDDPIFDYDEPIHAVALVGPEHVADVNGIQHESEVLSNLAVLGKPKEVKLLEVGENDLMYTFTIEGVRPAEIEAASTFIDNHINLFTETPTPHAS